MKRWMLWLAAALAAMFAAGLSVAHPGRPAPGPLAACAGSPLCTGPPGRHPVLTAGRLLRAKVPHEAAYHAAPRVLSPAKMAAHPGPLWVPGGVVQVDGRAFTVVARLRMSATTYTTGEPGVGTTTFTGTRARVGEAAVDPRFLPLGSWLYVTGYHTPYLPANGILEHAEDIGALIKGDRIDLYMAASFQALAQFGRQPVTAYLLVPLRSTAAAAVPGRPPR